MGVVTVGESPRGTTGDFGQEEEDGDDEDEEGIGM